MELALSLGNRGVENNNSVPFCMGSSSSARSTAQNSVAAEDNNNNNHNSSNNNNNSMKDDDDDHDQRRDDVGSSSSSDPSPLQQLDLLPFSPVPRPTQAPPPLRFPWLADNLSSEPGSSDGPGSKIMEANRRAAVGPTTDDVEDQSSPNSGTSSFMEFSLYTHNNNNNGGVGKGKRELNGSIGNNNNNYGQEIIGIGGNGNGNGDQGERGATTSRGSDDEENGSTRKKLRLSKEQSAFLEESFKEHHTLNPKQKLALAKQLNLRPRQVEVWFQNRRARTKLKQTEVDCEYLKRCCETLTEENRRLQKELQELRALKTSQPFFMQLPATTLTMCPSCERVAPTSTSSANAAIAPATPTATATTTTTAMAVTVAANGTAASGSPCNDNNNNSNSEVTLSLGKPKAMLPFSKASS
ncbi:Homeobox-leucine zipper protein HAT14 [Bienertia sinuspersici]